MKILLTIDEFLNAGKDQVGGKAYCLAKIQGLKSKMSVLNSIPIHIDF